VSPERKGKEKMTRSLIVALMLSPALGSLWACDTASPPTSLSAAGAAQEGGSSALFQEKGGEEPYLTGHYEVVTNWPQPLPGHEEWVWGATTGIAAESPNRVFVVQRGELPRPQNVKPGWSAIAATPGRRAEGNNRFEHCIYVVDASGRIVETWPQWDKLFVGGRGPHKVAINPYDPEKHVWVVDDMVHQIFKFTNDGKQLVLTLGERLKSGNDDTHFNRPTDIAFLPDGSFFISDGYANTRVVKFDKNGRFVKTWGTPGTAPGQFNLPHGVATDRNRRVYVADRSNSRIQVFDENGTYIDQWPDINSPFDIDPSADGHMWVADGETNKMLKYDLNGRLVYAFGTYGLSSGFNWGIHQFSGDADGNMYWAETYAGRAQKLRPRTGADSRNVFRPLTAQ
jgi:peptidylamidoglycolate lyase